MTQPGDFLKRRYLVERELGRGGFGVVYLARDEQLLGRHVVIKELTQESLQEEWVRRKFEQEIEALVRIDHPGIVSVFDSGTTPVGAPFVVMQYIEGRTLREVMTGKPLPFEFVAGVITQAGRALAAAHARSVVHRDLKPENIMLQSFETGAPHVKIIDFGVARVERSRVSADTTAVGLVAGTCQYMAPEQLCGEAPAPATDVFALAVIAYEMLAGHLPFRAPSPALLFGLIQRASYARLSDLLPGIPAAVEPIIGKALSFNSFLRHQAADEFSEELSWALVGGSGSFRALSLPAGHPSAETSSRAISGAEHPTIPMGPVRPVDEAPLVLEESIGGAVPLDSPFYVVRTADQLLRVAMERQDSIVLIKGARQMGKTSLLARGAKQARADGRRVILTDFQKLNSSDLQSVETLYLALGDLIAGQLDLPDGPERNWNARRAPNVNFERFLRRDVIGKVDSPLVWALDEADRLFRHDYASEVFGLFRSWHNERSLDPAGPWQRLTLAISYATEAHLFIRDVNQSPFNVGTRIVLNDFTLREVEDLNERYGAPLKSENEIHAFFRLLGGQPYLTRCGFHALTADGLRFTGLVHAAEEDGGPFSEHLSRMMALAAADREIEESLRSILHRGGSLPSGVFYRLRSAGFVRGESAADVRLRCQLYHSYLKNRLR